MLEMEDHVLQLKRRVFETFKEDCGAGAECKQNGSQALTRVQRDGWHPKAISSAVPEGQFSQFCPGRNSEQKKQRDREIE